MSRTQGTTEEKGEEVVTESLSREELQRWRVEGGGGPVRSRTTLDER